MRSPLSSARLVCHLFQALVYGLVALTCLVGPAVSFGQVNGSPLVPEATAQRLGLVRAWWRQAPVDITRDRVESYTLAGDTLYVQTRRGTVSALDSETGLLRWTHQIGLPEMVTTGVGANDKFAAVCNGSKIFVLAHDDGKLVFERKLRNVPGAAPAMSATHVFTPTTNGSIESYDVSNPKRPPQIYNSTGRAMSQPFSVGGTLAWTTDRGLFYVAQTEPLSPRFRVETNEPIIVGPGYQTPFLYVGSMDGHVMKVHELTGNIVWKTAVGEPVDSRPTMLGDRLYVSSRRGGVRCLVAESGALVPKPGEEEKAVREATVVWHAPSAGRILAGSAKNLYCLDDIGRMVILRRDDGGYVDTLQLSGAQIVVLNDVTDRIYIGTPGGTVQCLHEAGLPKPLEHRRIAAKKDEVKAPKQKGLEDQAEPKEQPQEKKEGGNFGDDLFGGQPKEGADKKAAPEKKAEAEDPFGAAEGDGGAKKAPPKKKAAEDDTFGAPAEGDGGAKQAPAEEKKKPMEEDPFS